MGLGDLIAWTMGAALVASAGRRVSPAEWFAPPIDVDRLLGITTVALAVFLGIGILRQVIAFVGRRRAEAGRSIRWAVGWRLVAIALLACFFVEEGALLNGVADDPAAASTANLKRLLPVTGTLAMAGIVAGLLPGRVRPKRAAWLSVVWAGVAGLAIAASQSTFPYLVLLALEAVRNAMPGPAASRIASRTFHDRMAHAGLELLPALTGCLLLGLCLSRELRHPRERNDRRFRSLLLPIVAASTALGAVWLLTVTIPTLDEWLAEGLWTVVQPQELAAIVLGFAGLAIGPAARMGRLDSLEPDPDPQQDDVRRAPSLIGLLLKTALALVLFDLIMTRLLFACGLAEWSGTRWVGWMDAAVDNLRSFAPSPLEQVWRSFQSPEWVVVAFFQAWIAWRVALLLLTPIGLESIPIDASLGDRRSAAGFLIRWVSLFVLMIAALPVLLVAGLVLIHMFYRGVG